MRNSHLIQYLYRNFVSTFIINCVGILYFLLFLFWTCTLIIYSTSTLKQRSLIPQQTKCHIHNINIQGPAFNVTHFESKITHLLYTARNTAEHG
jgi:hypothetical protein